jgi:UDP-N-acetyl-D-glucosamine dehydrogenase
LIELLRERGAHVSYCDPYIPTAKRVRKFDLDLASVPCTPEEFAKYDAVLLSTPHDQFKDPALYQGAKLVIDTRNVIPFAQLKDTQLVRA